MASIAVRDNRCDSVGYKQPDGEAATPRDIPSARNAINSVVTSDISLAGKVQKTEQFEPSGVRVNLSRETIIKSLEKHQNIFKFEDINQIADQVCDLGNQGIGYYKKSKNEELLYTIEIVDETKVFLFANKRDEASLETTQLGGGAYGRAALCINLMDGEVYARKTSSFSMVNEIDACKQLEGVDGVAKFIHTSQHKSKTNNKIVKEELLVEYCPRGSIKKLAQSGTRFTKEEREKIIKQLKQTVAAMHAKGIAHGDLHWDNIMLTENNEIRIIDFGRSFTRACFIDESGWEAKKQQDLNDIGMIEMSLY